jgi:hypothetical protein
MPECIYCDREYQEGKGYRGGMCACCSGKFPLRHRFAKARDEVRVLCGLERLGDQNDG